MGRFAAKLNRARLSALCIFVLILNACAPAQKITTIQLKIKNPKNSGFTSQDNFQLSDDYCYAIMVSAEDNEELNRYQFNENEADSTCVSRPNRLGKIFGLFKVSDEISIEVPIGLQRRFDLIGIKKNSTQTDKVNAPSDCQGLLSVEVSDAGASGQVDVFIDGIQSEFEKVLIANGTADIVVGNNDVFLTPMSDPNGVSLMCNSEEAPVENPPPPPPPPEVAGPPDVGNSAIVAVGPFEADNISTSSITILLKDASGIAISGITPTISVSGSNNNSISLRRDRFGTYLCK